jgi:Ribonuclease G/E
MRRELIISAGPGEWRAALLEDAKVVELRAERGDGVEAGSLHLGRVVRLLPALGAALVDIGGERPAFLPQSQIFPRGRRLAEGEPVMARVRREAQGGKAAQLTTNLGALADFAARGAGAEPPMRLFPAPTIAAALAGVLPATGRILVDAAAAIPELRAAFADAEIMPLAQTDWPVDLDAVFAEALAPTILLANGGSLHFEPARTAVMIDIDSGSPEAGSPEQTALAVNLAAAKAIARQIRLRNLAGGIVVDFVGLDNHGARERVRAALARQLTLDPMQPQILGWTRLGHLELVRRRRTRPVAEQLLEPAPGGGLVKTAATVAYEALRAVGRAARAQPGCGWRLTAAAAVAAALTGEANPALRATEQRLGRMIAIVADPGLERDRFRLEPV